MKTKSKLSNIKFNRYGTATTIPKKRTKYCCLFGFHGRLLLSSVIWFTWINYEIAIIWNNVAYCVCFMYTIISTIILSMCSKPKTCNIRLNSENGITLNETNSLFTYRKYRKFIPDIRSPILQCVVSISAYERSNNNTKSIPLIIDQPSINLTCYNNNKR